MAQTVMFTIQVDPALIPDADLSPLLDALQDFEPVLEEFIQTLQSGERAGFETQGGAFGLEWAPLADSTVKERFRRGYGPDQPLVRTGNLADHIGQAVNLTPSSVDVGIDLAQVPYAADLQSPHRPSQPPRVLVAVTDDMVDAMMQQLQQFLANATGGDSSGITIETEMA